MIKAKLRAVALHTLVSAAVAAAVAGLILFVWFPGDYASLLRGQRLFTLVAVCDVALGPVLSLVVYDPAKSRRALLLDYSVIAALQIAALVYGASVIAQSRPVFTVFAIDAFEVANAGDVEITEADRGSPVVPSWLGPRLAELQLPAAGPAHNQALDLELQGRLLSGMPRYLRPYRHAAALAKAHPVTELVARFPRQRAAVEAVAASAGLPLPALSWLPVKTRFGVQTALLSREREGILGFVDQDPY